LLKSLWDFFCFSSYSFIGGKYMDYKETSSSHSIVVTDRNHVAISGVLRIDHFDEEEFLFETTLGHLLLKGSSLELVLLDTKEGKVVIHGEFSSMDYLDSLKNKASKQSSLFEKLFK